MLKVKSAINEALIYILLSHILFQLEGKIHYPYCISTDIVRKQTNFYLYNCIGFIDIFKKVTIWKLIH